MEDDTSRPEHLESGIRRSRARLEAIKGRLPREAPDGLDDGSARWVALAALEELEHTLEELRVVEEERRLQNEAILAQQQLLEIEHGRYRELFELAPTAYVVTSPTAVVREANHAACQLLGIALELIRGKPLISAIARSEREEFRRRVRLLGEGGPLDEWESVAAGPGDPVPVHVRAAPIRDRREETIGIRWIFRDLSVEKRLEKRRQELVRSEAARKAAERAAWRAGFLERAGELLSRTLDERVGLEYVGRHAVSEFCQGFAAYLDDGDGPERLVLCFSDLASEAALGDFEERFDLSPDDSEARLADAMKTGGPLILAETSGSRAGRGAAALGARGEPGADGPRRALVFPLRSQSPDRPVRGAVVFLNEDGGLGFDREDYVLAQELTYRIEMYIENCRLHDRVRKALRAREEIARMVSHDLRNALQLVSLYGTCLLQQTEGGEDSRYIAPILGAVDRMRHLVDDLVRESDLDAEEMHLDRRALEVEPLLEKAAELFRQLADEQQIRLRVEPDGGLPRIWADEERLLQVLSNLVGNALRFADQGGWVAFRAGVTGRQVRLSVADNGIGVAEEELERILEGRLDGGPGRGADGQRRGLGLAIVRRIVEAHGGSFSAESRPGVGSTFHVSLPTAEAAEEGDEKEEEVRTA